MPYEDIQPGNGNVGGEQLKDIKEYEIELESPWGDGNTYHLVPVRGEYAKNGALAVKLFDVDNYEEFAVITTNLMQEYTWKDTAYVDTNNCDWVKELLEDSGLAKPTGNTARSGYCVYPEYEFDLSKTVTDDELNDYLASKEVTGKPEMIRVIMKEEGGDPYVAEIENDFHAFQDYVGGLIDMDTLPGLENEVDIIFNDDYMSNYSNPSLMLPEYDNIMGGNLIFAGYDPEDGSTISLTDEQIDKVMDYVQKNKVNETSFIAAYTILKQREKAMGRENALAEAEL